MKTSFSHLSHVLVGIALLLLLNISTVLGQSSGGSYRVTSSVVAGGAGSSTGSGSVAVDATSGESAAVDQVSQSSHALKGGFWPTTLTPSGPTAAPATISGRVTTTSGAPLAGVTISLGGAGVRRTITDSDGQYHFENVDLDRFYVVTPTRVDYFFSPANRAFSLVASKTDAVFKGDINLAAPANPLDMAEFLVRQQYVDMLGREPDEAGFNYWSDQINICGNDSACVNAHRRDVAAAFFIEQEFQQTGSFVYRMYEATFGRRPSYAEFSAGRERVTGGVSLAEKQQAFAAEWVSGETFRQQYPDSLSATEFVNKLFDSARLQAFDQRQQQIDAMLTGSKTRAAVLRDTIEITEFKNREYNPSFVLMQYFGYLRRDPDQGGYEFWLNILDNQAANSYRRMVCSFITSAEYQNRFSPVVSHSNAECVR